MTVSEMFVELSKPMITALLSQGPGASEAVSERTGEAAAKCVAAFWAEVQDTLKAVHAEERRVRGLTPTHEVNE
jgi:hypothetical protein